MEAAVKAAEVLATPQPGVEDACPEEGSSPQAASIPTVQALLDPMEDLSRKLEDILKTYGTADTAVNQQSMDPEKMEGETGSDVPVTKETAKDDALVIQSLNKLKSKDEKLDTLIQKYAELADVRRSDERKVGVLQQKVTRMQRERDQLRSEHQRGVLARSQLEGLCRELQKHNKTLKEETLRRCREDEEKRKEVSSHFQSTLNDIQVQIEQYSGRNNKLCQENKNLAEKLESLMHQYEQREETLEKVNHHRELQHKLAEAKLEQANALLAEAEDKHRREKEYLLREAIDKTKKCFTLKEQELTMKKKLTLYSQKFDEFQTTLSKSNDIYVSFKTEMDKMTKKMKKLEKESDVWKERFESCNKALADMVTERADKGKEFELFVLKISKLETLCRALQEERKVLYDKIKDVRSANAGLPALLYADATPTLGSDTTLGSNTTPAPTQPAGEGTPLPPLPRAPERPVLSEPDLAELQKLQDTDPALTEDMARLRAEQARLQEFAASLFTPMSDTSDEEEEEEEEGSKEEQLMASVFGPTTTSLQEKSAKKGAKAVAGPVPVEPVPVEPVKVEPVPVEPVKVEPVKVEPVKVEPVKVEPVPVEPVPVEPVPVEPVLQQSVVPEDVRVEVPAPAVEPIQKEPSNAAQPTHQSEEVVVKSEPAKADPAAPAAPIPTEPTLPEAEAAAPAAEAVVPVHQEKVSDVPKPLPTPEPTAHTSADTPPEGKATPKQAAPTSPQQPISNDSSKKQASKKKKKNAKKAS
ncbi:alpha-taxilin isoform X1 [Gadus macrocephalus]|uniref:alpha-taxilin isoform X1 n=1 Tax=Gadus macrocephalus TaxID=80720 RepID=UPI0028CB653E|nr:alpha-taxilin isoform X1 [Gadus macrocephalus]XP_059898529.1 alpha-taxilin isoform X1 [Gadus macrocephalus]